MVEKLIEEVLRAATVGAQGMARARAARAEYVRLGGAFEDSDPWFEERTQAFLDWFVLDWREQPSAPTPAESHLARGTSEADRLESLALCRAIRGLFRVDEVEHGRVALTELCGGARFLAEPMGEASGLGSGDLVDGHLIPWRERVLLARGLVFHPRQARAAIEDLVPRALAAGESREGLLFALLRMRMRFDHYRGISAEKVYRFPFAAFP